MISVQTSKRVAVIAAVAVAAICCSPTSPTSSDPDWIRFDPGMLDIDKPMPTIWIAPKRIQTTGLLPQLIVLEREKFREVAHAAAESCASARGPHPLDTSDRYYSIVKSVAEAEQPWCTLSPIETCATARKFRQLGLEPGFDKLSDAFEPLLMRAGCVIGRAKF